MHIILNIYIFKVIKINIKYMCEYGIYNVNDLLINASDKGNYDIIKILLGNIAKICTIHFKQYIEALLLSSYNGHYDIVKLFIENGGIISVYKDIALSCASRNGHYDIVKLLLDNGANYDLTLYGFFSAKKNSYRNIVKLLKQCRDICPL